MSTGLRALLAADVASWAKCAGEEMVRERDGRSCCMHAARMAGANIGRALRYAHTLVDDGADPADVRELLEIGLQAGSAAS